MIYSYFSGRSPGAGTQLVDRNGVVVIVAIAVGMMIMIGAARPNW
jgi:hypothetical protein